MMEKLYDPYILKTTDGHGTFTSNAIANNNRRPTYANTKKQTMPTPQGDDMAGRQQKMCGRVDQVKRFVMPTPSPTGKTSEVNTYAGMNKLSPTSFCFQQARLVQLQVTSTNRTIVHYTPRESR